MQKRLFPIVTTAIIIFTIFAWSCTKLDITDLGSDLLPAVDNINTFDTVLTINSAQGFFNDSQYIGKYDDYAVGSISNDPLFGLTKASIFMQLKPKFYPFYFGNAGDTINTPDVGVDSVILCLKYKGFWGDSSMPVHLEVREVNDVHFRDSVNVQNTTAVKPNVMGAILATKDVDVKTLGNYIKINRGRDSVNNQIRIKLPATFAATLFNRDSTTVNATNNAFYSDSAYRILYNGIAIIGGGGGNGLIYASLNDTATRLEIHYRKKNRGVYDTTYSSFILQPVLSPSAIIPVSNTSDYIQRTRAGYPVSSPGAGEHYIQTAPGTFVSLNIPGLPGLSNRIVHRAEIIVQQIPTDPVVDARFSAPNFLYLDLKDTVLTSNLWKPLYFDLNNSQAYDPDYKNSLDYLPTTIDFQYFGGYKRNKPDGLGNQIQFYNFNVTKYVQQIVTNHAKSYDLRVYAPFYLSYPQYAAIPRAFSNNIAFGRVRVGSGSNANYTLKMRIVYSKIK